jgi:hypothetical protein
MHPNGRTLFALKWDRTLRVWDVAEGRELHRWPTPVEDQNLNPYCWKPPLALSPDAKTLAVRGEKEFVRLLDATTGSEQKRFGEHKDILHGIAFAPDGQTLVTWCRGHIVHIWDMRTGHELRQFPLAGKDLLDRNPMVSWTAALSPDGRLLAACAYDRLSLYEMATGKELREALRLPYSTNSHFAFSADGRTLAMDVMKDSAVRLIEVHTLQERQQLQGHRASISSLAFSADNRFLVSGSEDTTALIWDLTGRLGAGDKWNAPLTAAELESFWADLASDDAARAWKAMQRLAAAPSQGVPLVSARLHPIPKVDEAKLNRLIADLDSNQFAVREQATKELEAMGELAMAAYRKTLESQPTLEVRRRLEALLAKAAESQRAPSGDRLRALRAVELLERIGTPEAKKTIADVASGAPGALVTEDAKGSLERLQSRERR